MQLISRKMDFSACMDLFHTSADAAVHKQVMSWCVDYAVTLLLVFFALWLAAALFRKEFRKNRGKSLLLSAICAAVYLYCQNFAFLSLGYIAGMFCLFFISLAVTLLYREKYTAGLSFAAVYYVSVNAIAYAWVFLISRLSGDAHYLSGILVPGGERFLFLAIVMGCIFALVFLLRRVFISGILSRFGKGGGRADERLPKLEKWLYRLMFLAVGCAAVYLYFSRHIVSIYTQYLNSEGLDVAVILVLVLFVVFFSLEIRQSRRLIQMQEVKNAILEEKYRAISDIYEKNARLYHDLNNHLNVLYQLLDNQEIAAAKDYLSRIGEPVRALSKKVWTGVDIVDVIINSALARMETLGIFCEPDLDFPQNTRFAANDLCSILSNLLDNAIEAAADVTDTEKKITFVMRRIKNFVLIKVENPYLGQRDDKHLLTTKENKSMHGWGLKNVESAVKKYDGSLTCEAKGGVFWATVLLFL